MFQCLVAIAQLGERQTEDLKVPGSIPGLGTILQAEKVAIPQSYLVLGPGEELRKEVFRMASGSNLSNLAHLDPMHPKSPYKPQTLICNMPNPTTTF